VIVRNMPGADGRVALNFFVRNAKPDGLMITTGSGTQLDPLAFRSAHAQYDPTKFNFIGGISRGGTFQVISKSGEERLKDKSAAPVAVGAVDGTRSGEQMISWGMEFLDWNAKWVVGYRGANETSIALERGEVDLVTTANSFLIKRLTDTGKFKVLSQSGVVVDGKIRRRTDFPDTPVMAELIASKLADPVARDAFRYLEAMCLVDPWVSLPPNTPPDIVAAYREAFQKMLADPEFIEKGKRISEDIGPMTHADVELLVKTASDRMTPAASIHPQPADQARYQAEGINQPVAAADDDRRITWPILRVGSGIRDAGAAHEFGRTFDILAGLVIDVLVRGIRARSRPHQDHRTGPRVLQPVERATLDQRHHAGLHHGLAAVREAHGALAIEAEEGLVARVAMQIVMIAGIRIVVHPGVHLPGVHDLGALLILARKLQCIDDIDSHDVSSVILLVSCICDVEFRTG